MKLKDWQKNAKCASIALPSKKTWTFRAYFNTWPKITLTKWRVSQIVQAALATTALKRFKLELRLHEIITTWPTTIREEALYTSQNRLLRNKKSCHRKAEISTEMDTYQVHIQTVQHDKESFLHRVTVRQTILWHFFEVYKTAFIDQKKGKKTKCLGKCAKIWILESFKEISIGDFNATMSKEFKMSNKIHINLFQKHFRNSKLLQKQ